MSRTFKDKPNKLQYGSYLQDTERVKVNSVYYDSFTKTWEKYLKIVTIYLPTTKPKKRKHQDTEDHWMSTPGWWVRLTMNKPQRRAVKLWERKALFSDLEDLVQPAKKVAHIYYW